MRFSTFFKIYTICALLQRFKLNILVTKLFKNKQFLWNSSNTSANFAKSANIAKMQNFSWLILSNFVALKKCWKTSVYYLLAKIGAETAENEQHFAEILPIGRRVAGWNRRSQAAEQGPV